MRTITPHLWFDKEARQAAELYVSLFENSRITNVATLHDTPSGSVDVVSFDLSGHAFMAISAGPLFTFNPSVSFLVACQSKQEVDAAFNEAISFMVRCDTQEDIDYYWEKLSAVPQAEQCGWLKDRYGLSWQIVAMDEMMRSADTETMARVTKAFLRMKKFDIAELQKAYEGR
jgi:predicted 3-demethylubiquinone-9 3-methyltransferase (glyoxalase superfamily)